MLKKMVLYLKEYFQNEKFLIIYSCSCVYFFGWKEIKGAMCNILDDL